MTFDDHAERCPVCVRLREPVLDATARTYGLTVAKTSDWHDDIYHVLPLGEAERLASLVLRDAEGSLRDHQTLVMQLPGDHFG